MENELDPTIVGGALRLAAAVAMLKRAKDQTETVFSIADNCHIAQLTRHRDGANVITGHTHCGVTLCGRKMEKIEPYKPARLLIGELRAIGCVDCVNVFFDIRADLT